MLSCIFPELSSARESDLQLEETLVIGRRDLSTPLTGSASAETLDAASQVSLNRTVGDWIDQEPGVSLNGQGGLLQAYSIRGFSRARVRTELVGVPIITDRRAGNSASFVPPDLLGEVVVEKAASSVLYGSGAMGGVVSLAMPSVDGASLSVEARSNDEGVAMTLMGGDSESLAGGLALRRAENAKDADNQALNTSFEQIAGFLQGRADLGSLDLRYSWVPSLGRDIGKSNRAFPDDRRSSYPEEIHSVAQMELRSGGDWLLRAYHHYQDWETDVLRVDSRRNLTTYAAHTVGGLFYAPSSVLSDTGSWGLEWVGRRGVSIKDREFTADDTLLIAQSVVDADEDNLGIFADQLWTFGDLSLSGGLRFDFVSQSSLDSEDSDSQLSGSMSIDYALSSNWRIDAEVASGYRFPSVSERYFSGTTPRGDVQGNPELNPETRRNMEVDLHYTPTTARFSASASVYYSDLDDYIERFAVSEELLGFRNLESASIHGIELDLRFDTGAFSHRFSYQWQEGEDDAGNTLSDLNPSTLRYFLSWERDDTSAYSDFSYRQSRDEFGAGELPLESALIWNARLRQRWTHRWSGELFLTNILDEDYRSAADDLAPVQPGRVLGLRIQWRQG
ncbi:MAG: TonB-dependent receptor plug domain-containing protein [Congregibacter sp.]